MIDITQEWKEYEAGKDYNRKLKPNLYNTVNQNERFYAGDQWYGVQSNGLPTPVFNIFKRIINYFIAAILSQKVTMAFFVEGVADATEDPQEMQLKETAEFIGKYSNSKWEHEKMDELLRDGLLDGCISGDYGAHVYWDEDKNDFCTELVDNVNVFFGNPCDKRVEKQPYILIAGRDMVSNLRNEARKNGVPENDILAIVSDTDNEEQSGDRGKLELDNVAPEHGRCTYIIKYWKDENTGTTHYRKSVKTVTIKQDVDTGRKRYPVAWANWDRRKNSYHGQALGTGLIPNQVYINKQFALVMKHMMDTAFSKAIYDKTRIAAWSNAVGTAIGVEGDIVNAATYLQPGQMNSNVLNVIEMAVSMTKDLVGATDAALGDVKPDNTSAIIAVQKASAIPLELPKSNLYQFVEDIGYIWLDFITTAYDVPRKLTYEENGERKVNTFTGTDYQGVDFKIKVEVGPSSFWSEISAMQTLDNLLSGGFIEFIDYLKRIPDGMIPDKQGLIDKLEQVQQQNQFQYEQMARFMESLPPEIQSMLQQMPPEEMEPMIQQMMMMQPEELQAYLQQMIGAAVQK